VGAAVSDSETDADEEGESNEDGVTVEPVLVVLVPQADIFGEAVEDGVDVGEKDGLGEDEGVTTPEELAADDVSGLEEKSEEVEGE
jgi:hypothetical protein